MAKNDDSLIKIVATALGMAVVLYIVSFSFIEHRRTFRGPWEVVFESDNGGNAAIVIRQPALKIAETVAFPGEKVAANLNVREQFGHATNEIPFGKVVFQDPTFLPGTLTLDFFGHEVEALPRVLVIDKQEHAWEPSGRVEVRKRN